jgi:signal transduction histidine kinase
LLGILLLSFLPIFEKLMQPVLSVGVTAAGLGLVAITAVAQPTELGYLFYYAGFILVPMMTYSFVHLRFWHATAANLVIATAYLTSAFFYQKILNAPHGLVILLNNCFFIVAANVAGMATCYYLERSARQYFLANYLLEQERVGEQRKRERTEAMLQILGQAIGGIVHDFGNPLTVIRVALRH